MKKKLLFIGSLPPPIGGVSTINLSFQQLLSDSYEIISFDTSNNRRYVDLYTKIKLKDLIYSIKLLWQFLFFAFRNRNTTANIFITSGKAFLRTILIYFIGYIFKIRFITHLHSKTEGEYFLEKRRIFFFTRLINYFSRNIIVLSNYHKYHFCEYGLDLKKIYVIENFVDYSKYKCSINNKNHELLYVGRLSKRKGVFDLFNSLKIIKDSGIEFKLHIIGDYDKETTQQQIVQFISSNQLEENIMLHGGVFGNKKFELYKKCGIFIFPSHFENSPIVIKEAIASSMAILCSDIDANKLILDPFENKIFHRVGDSVDIADKLLLLLKHPKKTNNMMKSSSLINQFDSKIAKTKFVSIINNLSK